jgi:hypothetical protein
LGKARSGPDGQAQNRKEIFIESTSDFHRINNLEREMLTVLVAKLHRSVVWSGARREREKFRFEQASRQTHIASIFLEQAGFKAMFANQILA